MKLLGHEVGPDRPLFLIAGPCAIESEALALETATILRDMAARLGVQLIYKSSFDKANRSSASSFRGPGLDKGLAILERVKSEIGVPVLTDVHEDTPIDEVASVVDAMQTPAFLCRQTNYIERVARAGIPVNIKKGQFPGPRRHGQRRRQGARRRQRHDHGVRARRLVRLQQPRLGHALAGDHARHGMPRRVRRDALGAAARGPGRLVGRAARVRAGARARGRRRRRVGAVHGDRTRTPTAPCRTVRTRGRSASSSRCWRRSSRSIAPSRPRRTLRPRGSHPPPTGA